MCYISAPAPLSINTLLGRISPRYAMLARCYHRVSVHLLVVRVLLDQRNIGSSKQRHTIAQGL